MPSLQGHTACQVPVGAQRVPMCGVTETLWKWGESLSFGDLNIFFQVEVKPFWIVLVIPWEPLGLLFQLLV